MFGAPGAGKGTGSSEGRIGAKICGMGNAGGVIRQRSLIPCVLFHKALYINFLMFFGILFLLIILAHPFGRKLL